MSDADSSPPRSRGHAHEAAAARLAPLELWRVAEGFLRTLHMLFGAPEEVAAKHTLTATAHGVLAAWLRCAEAMLRRLLAIEAQAYAKPNTRPLLKPPRRRVRKLVSFTAEEPEKWRVSFRSFHKDCGLPARRKQTLPAGSRQSLRFRSAWPLAERYEALLRVFNDPAAYARRLAKRLHAAPHRLAELMRAPEDAVHRVDGFAAMGEGARCAWRVYFSSG